MAQTIAVLDFGSQYTQVIARRIRECQVYSKIYHYSVTPEQLEADGVAGIILSGGPSSVFSRKAPIPDRRIFDLGVPVLGICYGIQLMGHLLGGKVAKSDHREYGHGTLAIRKPGRLFAGLPKKLRVWNSHGDRVIAMPPGFEAIGTTENSEFAAIEDRKRNFYGIQSHPEVFHSERGTDVLKNYLLRVCGASQDWTMNDFIEHAVENIRTTVGKSRVILGLSGGVDSSVAAALIHRAIGKQLTCVFVDNGLLRLNEADQVMATFAQNLGVKVIHVDAREQFTRHLAGVTDPEQKRKIIGREFVEVFQAESAKLPAAKWLAQGTIYPDVIESAGAKTKKAHTIKSHHNVGGLPDTLHLKLLEPLRELFKDEVRDLGLALGLPPDMVYRHPFPGPGLGVRILGEVKPEYADLLRRADAIFIEELRNTRDEATGKSWYELTSQAFAVFLPVKSVGVMGDGRTYEYVVALRAVETTDFMTAGWAELPYALLARVSGRIINEVRGINRVVYDVSS